MSTRVAAIAGAAVLATVGLTQAASAAPTPVGNGWYELSFSTAGRGAPGYANATVDAKFSGPRRVRYDGWVQDDCPANGMGAYLTIRVNFMNGAHRQSSAKETRGCDHASGTWGYPYQELGGKYQRKVKSVSGRLCEIDTKHDHKSICTRWKAIDNPYT